MNPNSGNQRWSKWTFTIVPGGVKRPLFAVVRANAARFARHQFGSASQMKVEIEATGRITCAVRSEGHPAHDPAYVTWMSARWQQWAIAGWGHGTTLTCAVRFEAGSRQDGTPPDQLIIGPPLHLCPRL